MISENELGKLIVKGRVLSEEPMSHHTTMRTGGIARYFVSPADEKELSELTAYLKGINAQYFIIGNGSNLLVSDSGYDGVIIDLGPNDGTSFSMLGVDGDTEDGSILFDCGAGCLLSAIGSIAQKLGASGFERLCGIPGCIGGACIMNAGAYGSEMKDVLRSIDVLTSDGLRKTVSAADAGLTYRHSKLMDSGSIVLRAELRLIKDDPGQIALRCREYAEKRREKQPLEYPSAGSAFKRPEGAYAGQLIENAGLKGYSVGGAAVSEKHAGFIINKGGATASDVYRLIEFVRKTVFEKSGIMLEPEIRTLGQF